MKDNKAIKERICKALAVIGYFSAVKSSGTASGYCCYQPKEPKVLCEMKIKP